jgi:FAD/FMN-containing dehydrogenase
MDVRMAHARDASGIELIPESVVRAQSVDDVIDAVRVATAENGSITAAGSQTSMTGASICDRGTLLSLAAMNRLLDVNTARGTARVQPGMTIGQLNRELTESGLMFAPDPTSEEDATVGGAIACNASGARSLFYGATRNHVAAVKVVHADGSVADYVRSHPEKNAVGYAAAQDPVDWFVGSEGTLGVVVEAELSLVVRPAHVVGLAIPFRTESTALGFVVAAREHAAGRRARCLEFFDGMALSIAGSSTGKPWTSDAQALVYLEDDAGRTEDIDVLLESWLALAELHQAFVDDIRVYDGAQALREAREMRHAVPATMNERGAAYRKQGGRKVSTDWAVPYARLSDALAASREAIERNSAPHPATYGHAGNGHPHQNFIAEDPEMLSRVYCAVEETLERVVSMGGTVSAEHGLGKLKKGWLPLQMSPRQIDVMRAIKNTLDPNGILAPGNIL